MKRTRPHVLENESRKALENLLPPEWIYRKKDPDYAIDAEIQIVEDEKVTEKVVWVQLKATEEKPGKKRVRCHCGIHDEVSRRRASAQRIHRGADSTVQRIRRFN